jgi:hypothetical protein
VQITSTDAGIHIDFNDWQFEKAKSSIRVSFEPSSNAKLSNVHPSKQCLPMISMSWTILMKWSRAKYRSKEIWAKSVRKSLETLKCEFPSSTSICEILVFIKAELSIVSTDAGMQIDSKLVQPWKAHSPICAIFDPDSYCNVFIDPHSRKHLLPIRTTEAGMKIDPSDEQFAKAISSIRVKVDPNANMTVWIEVHSW